jgi:diacylglycerol kinase (ATP)
MKLAIIANPVAGRGRAYRKLQKLLARWPHPDWEVELLLTRGPEHAGELALRLAGKLPDLLAVCGGDGTISEVASSLPDPPFPIAILPAGTANVLAREFGISPNPAIALVQALSGTVQRIDSVRLAGRSTRRFLLMAGIGFDAQIVCQTTPSAKARIGMMAYVISIMKQISTYRFPTFQVATEEKTYSASSCVVCNARFYGSGMVFSPQADPRDGELDLVIVEGSNRIRYLSFLLSAQLRRPWDGSFVKRCRARTIRVEGARGIWIQADGELVGTLPVEMKIFPSSFPLIVPQKIH